MNKTFYKNNRQRTIENLEENSIAIILAGTSPKKTADEKYRFTPDRNFLYLTGIDEEEHILVMQKVNGKEESILFIKDINEEMEKWTGKTIRKDEAYEKSDVDNVMNISKFQNYLDKIIYNNEFLNIYLDLEKDKLNTSKFSKKLNKNYSNICIRNIAKIIGNLRMIKNPQEIDEIQKAIDITIEGVENLMKNSAVGMKEYQLEAYFDFVCKSNGIKDFAFNTIAASGKNATVLHYVDNDSILQNGELILFDLGAQYNYYNGDISRTFPVDGKFTPRQKEVYNSVLKVNKEIISLMKPGIKFIELNKTARALIAKECIKLGLINNEDEVSKYYYHSIGHSLGLDTHDYEPSGRDVELKEGMVYTVEPGIYIQEENIGIRIEDDVLITKDGNRVLTDKMIKEVEEIEKFMKKY